MRDKICIMVSQNPEHIQSAENVVCLINGKMDYIGENESSNNLNDAKHISTSSDKAIQQNEKTHEPFVIEDKKIMMLETEQQQSEKNVYHEVKKEGQVGLNVYKTYFQYGGGLPTVVVILLLYGLAQACDSSSDKMLSKW